LLKANINPASDEHTAAKKYRLGVGNGKPHHLKTISGCILVVEWKDGSTFWEKLSDLKESFPIEITEYTIGSKISIALTFAWWVPNILKMFQKTIAVASS